MKIKIIRNQKDIDILIRYIKEASLLTIDFETTSLVIDSKDFRILSCAIGNDKKIFVFPFQHKDSWFENYQVVPIFNALVKKQLLAQNIKYELRILMYLGYFNLKPFADTMLMANLLNENLPKGLNSLVSIYLPEYDGYWDLLEDSITKKDYESAPIEVLLNYNAYDVGVTHKLYNIFIKEINKTQKLSNYWNNYYSKMILPVTEMEHQGFCVNNDKLSELKMEYIKTVTNVERKIKNKHKDYFNDKLEFNFNSHSQKRHFLYKHMKVPILKTTKINRKTGGGGNPSTDEKTLEMLSSYGYEKPTMDLLVQREKAYTIIKSFINVFEKKSANSLDSFLRTNFNMHTVETGRLSSSSPNLQNIPTSAGLIAHNLPPIKHIFESRFRNGYVLSADYSQIELRMVACYSNDTNFVDAYSIDGRDLHGELAEQIYGKSYTKANRDRAKRTNFSAIFDITAETLSKNLKVTKLEADELLFVFRSMHPELYDWFDDLWIESRSKGFVENYNGRRRNISESLELATKEWEFERIKREVWNFPIQSSASEITISTLIYMNKWLKIKKLKSVIFGSVHDSILFDCYNKEEALAISKEIKHFASVKIPKLFKWIGKIKIKIDVEYGKDLHNVKEIK